MIKYLLNWYYFGQGDRLRLSFDVILTGTERSSAADSHDSEGHRGQEAKVHFWRNRTCSQPNLHNVYHHESWLCRTTGATGQPEGMILGQIEFIVIRPSSRLWDAAIRDLTKLRRQRQLQKAIGLVNKTTTLHVHHDCLYNFCRPCTTTTWNDNILSFFEDGNGKAINSIISVWTWARPPSLQLLPSFK